MPFSSTVKEEGVVPAMPPDAFVKVEIKEEERTDKSPKRQNVTRIFLA